MKLEFAIVEAQDRGPAVYLQYKREDLFELVMDWLRLGLSISHTATAWELVGGEWVPMFPDLHREFT